MYVYIIGNRYDASAYGKRARDVTLRRDYEAHRVHYAHMHIVAESSLRPRCRLSRKRGK